MKALGGLFVTLVLCAPLAACQGLGTANPELPLWANHAGEALSVRMKRQLTARTRVVDEPYERATPAIDPWHRRVFVGSSDHGLYAVRAIDGSTLWRFETAGIVASEPLYDPREDVVYFGSNDGALYKLRAADGKMLWRFYSAAEITRVPVLDGDVLYVTNANDTLIAIDPRTGKHRWHQKQPSAGGMEIAGYAGVAVYGDKVFTAFSDGRVMAFRKRDGAPMWEARLTTAVEQTRDALSYWDADATPVVAVIDGEPLVFAASYEGGVFALGADSGMQHWHNDGATGVTELVLWQGPSRQPPKDGKAVTHQRLIASSGLTGVWALSPGDGAEQWRRDLPAGGVTRAVAWEGALLVGTTRYGVFLFNPLDGGVLDGVHSGGAFAGAPATFGRQSFILSSGGTLWGFEVTPPRSVAASGG
jgi:outer membrane protein assembly factor BamB